MTESLGRGITLTREMYRRMGEGARQRDRGGYGRALRSRGLTIIPYASRRTDPRSHVRFS